MRRPVSIPANPKYIPFVGGMDTATPQISVNPGTTRSSQNIYGDVLSGIKTGIRYERYNGLPSPSNASYSILDVELTGSVSVGDVLTDSTAAAYGTVIALAGSSFELLDTLEMLDTTELPITYAVLTKVTGLFPTGSIKVGAAVVGTCEGPQSPFGASTPLLNAQLTALAADLYRADISAVPGSGIGRGIVEFEGVKYGFRDNSTLSAGAIYKSSAAGWVNVPLGFELDFTGGGETDSYVPQEDDVIVGVTSGATATLTRIVLESGSWAAKDAAGRFIFLTQTGTFVSEKLKVVLGGPYMTVATITGASDAITLLPGGSYEFLITNFDGTTEQRVYGCDGKNYGFEFDGTTFVQLHTGVTFASDIPTHIAELQQKLCFSIGPISEFSVVSDPYQWDLRLGSALLSTGADVTGYELQQGMQDTGSLVVYARNRSSVIYTQNSATVATWTIITHKNDMGSIEWSNQRIGNSFFLDDKGIAELRTTQKFGNFRDAIVSDQIKDWFIGKKDKVTHSCTFKEKNLYCIFFNDNSALYSTVSGGSIRDIMPQQLPHKVERIFSTENPSGAESVSFIDDNGFVYEMEKGTSFDGEDVTWWGDMAYNHLGIPYREKRFRRAVMEVRGDGYGFFYLSFSLNYGATGIIQPNDKLTQINLEQEEWDSGIKWDKFSWDGSDLEPADVSIKSKGTNISIKLSGDSDYEYPIRFSGVIIQHSLLQRLR